MAENALKFKVVLVGDPGVGKTSLVTRFVLNKFDEKYLTTLGTRVYKKEVSINVIEKKRSVMLMIWDTLGQKGFERTLEMAFHGARGALVVCDLTRKETFDNVKKWISMIHKSVGEVSIVIIANKSDLKDQIQFGESELAELGRKYSVPHHLTSAKTGDHVEESFTELGNVVIDHYLHKGESKNE